MKTECLIDIENNNFELVFGHDSKRLIVDFVLVGEESRQFDSRNLEFGYQLENQEGEKKENSWPLAGIKFSRLSTGTVTSEDLSLNMNTDYVFKVWCKNGDDYFEKEEVFNSGLPYKAYDSMVWNEETEEWDMLKPYPEDAEEPMFWDEEKLDWVVFDSETHV